MKHHKPSNREKTRIDDLHAAVSVAVIDEAALRLVTGGLRPQVSSCTGETLNGNDEGIDYD